MSHFFDNAAVWMGLQLFVKATTVVFAAALMHWLLGRRASASARHLALSFVVAGLLGLPVLAALLPAWEVPLPVTMNSGAVVSDRPADVAVEAARAKRSPDVDSAPAPAAATPSASPLEPIRASLSWPTALIVVYAWGVLVLLAYLTAEQLWVRRLLRQAIEIDDAGWQRLLDECRRSLRIDRSVRLFRSRNHTMPMTFGTRRPVILLPAVAETWDDDRRRAVVLHELAHVRRHDCLTQTLAAFASALYWPHPGVWWIARRLRIERELACDDLVLTAGTSARDYAGHLLELAHTLGGGRAPALVVTMARPRQLEGRMLAVMDAARSRTVPGLRSRLAGIVLAAAIVVPLASVQAVALDPTVPAPPTANVAPQIEHAAVASPVTEQVHGGVAGRLAQRTTPTAQASGAGAQSTFRGTWEIGESQRTGSVHLRMRERNWDSGFSIPVEKLEGFSTSQLSGAGGPIRFSIRRDAGTFNFEGTARDGMAGGVFTFSANAAYGAELEKRGYGRPNDAEQYSLARGDIGFAFLDELTKQGYSKPSLSQLVRAGEHGAQYDYLHEMANAGYRLGTIETLIRLRDHGVTPTFIRELADQNVKGLSADELQRVRDHGVTGDFIRGFRDLGYGSATVDDLVKAKDHGLNPDYVREISALGKNKMTLDELIQIRDHGVSASDARAFRDLGYSLTVDELVRAKDHGVSTDFVRELTSLGYQKVDLDTLVRLKDHGVSANFVRELSSLGYDKQPMDTLVRLRDHGVSPSFISELKNLGYDRIALDDAVTLRDHGVTADKIRRANDRAGTRLPLDMIRELASGGLR